ncbi:MAG: guanylate kinase [Alphaproteobacteria bacterium]|nr:guanylate kinase [Alphaproteobacteria bacterium]
MMIAFSSPSGAGKTSITRRLLNLDPLLRLSVSWTTRPMRQGEIDGQDYTFVDQAKFDAHARAGGFLEHAGVFGKSYGSPRGYVESAFAEGYDVVFDVDWQGARQLRESSGTDIVTIFILPPAKAQLLERLTKRGTDDGATVARRMAQANDEMSHWAEYDYVIVNDFLERALQEAHDIIAAERLRRHRQPGLAAFVAGLMAE